MVLCKMWRGGTCFSMTVCFLWDVRCGHVTFHNFSRYIGVNYTKILFCFVPWLVNGFQLRILVGLVLLNELVCFEGCTIFFILTFGDSVIVLKIYPVSTTWIVFWECWPREHIVEGFLHCSAVICNHLVCLLRVNMRDSSRYDQWSHPGIWSSVVMQGWNLA